MEPPSPERTGRRVASVRSADPNLSLSPQSHSPQLFGNARLREALILLRQGREYAADAQRDPWEFAVELRLLRRLGLTSLDFRWLTHKGYVEHRREVTDPDDVERVFRHNGLTFTKHSCFVLTRAGLEFARSLTASAPPAASEEAETISTEAGAHLSLIHDRSVWPAANSVLLPRWDCDYREIRYGDKIVKQFKLPSPNQEAILLAFQEEGWPPRIDDPLPPNSKRDPKQRLHDTIRSLNRNQKNRLLRFKGDGTGQGILWEPVQDGEDIDPSV